MLVPLVMTTVFKLSCGIEEIALVGMVAVSIGQPENAYSPMLVTLLPMVTLVNPEPENAIFPMLVTLSGMVTLVNLVQPRNAEPTITFVFE